MRGVTVSLASLSGRLTMSGHSASLQASGGSLDWANPICTSDRISTVALYPYCSRGAMAPDRGPHVLPQRNRHLDQLLLSSVVLRCFAHTISEGLEDMIPSCEPVLWKVGWENEQLPGPLRTKLWLPPEEPWLASVFSMQHKGKLSLLHSSLRWAQAKGVNFRDSQTGVACFKTRKEKWQLLILLPPNLTWALSVEH